MADISDMNQEQAMVRVNSVDSLEALAANHSFSDCKKGKDMNLKLAEKHSAIASILGICMEGRLDELKSFIFDTLEEEKSGATVGKRSKKKSRDKKELDKLVCSINYEKTAVDKENGVKLLGL